MTNKVAFINENDNDSHLDLQVKIEKKLFQHLIDTNLRTNIYMELALFITFYGKVKT